MNSGRLGARDTLPLVLASLPFGMVFGAMGQAQGLPDSVTMAFSILVFAGSSQFVAMTLLAVGASTLVIVLTTLVINLRHMLYGISLIPTVRHLPLTTRLAMGFFLTDETYATLVNRLAHSNNQQVDTRYYFGSGLLMYANWVFSTYLGILAGHQFPALTGFGLDIAMVVAFTGIIVANLTMPSHWICAAVAALSGCLTYTWPHNTGLLFSAVLAIIAGVLSEPGTTSCNTD